MKNTKSVTHTKGNIIVEEIKVGDIHYEYAGPFGIECKVDTTPHRDDEGNWNWVSKNTKTDEFINYFVHKDYPHYGPNLYDHKAYKVKMYI